MSDTRENGRDLAEDAAPAHDTARLAETDARADAAREPGREQKIEVSGSANGPEVQHTSAPWYLDERGHIRDPGTDVIIATVVDPDGMIPEDEQMANGRLIERAPLLHAAAAARSIISRIAASISTVPRRNSSPASATISMKRLATNSRGAPARHAPRE